MRLITGNPLKNVTALVLAGGLGTRLRSVLSERPKVLAPVRGRPFLAWILEYLYSYGIRDTIICTGYLAEQVQQTFGDEFKRMQLRYSVETSPLGTGGAVAKALRMETSDNVLVMNGDSLVEADLIGLWKHAAPRQRPSIVVTQVEATERFGRIEVDANGKVLAFREKATSDGPGLINAGIYFIPRALLEDLPSDRAHSLERELFPAWIQDGLFGFRAEGDFMDIGTPESFEAANDAYRDWQLFNFAMEPKIHVLN